MFAKLFIVALAVVCASATYVNRDGRAYSYPLAYTAGVVPAVAYSSPVASYSTYSGTPVTYSSYSSSPLAYSSYRAPELGAHFYYH